ncbi:MAG TPA: ACT domain-containing protein [Bacteroidetes bacterium]|nr:ACT domain-containing protein [Bacteroidota bacterium]
MNLRESMLCITFSRDVHWIGDVFRKRHPMAHKLTLQLLNETFTINKLPQFAEIPSILSNGEMCFISRTDEELSIVCPDFMAPNNVQQELGWRCLKVEGTVKLQEVGVLASILQPLSEAGVPVFTVSTFNTDYVFVMDEHLVNVVHALQKAGHQFHKEE